MATTIQRAKPFVGRAAELDALRELVEGNATRIGCVHGIAGMGKTELLSAFILRAEEAGATVVKIECRSVEPTERGFLAAVGGFDSAS